MRLRLLGIALAGLMSLGSLGCASSYEVRTLAAPKVSLTEFHTFHLLPTPRRNDSRVVSGAFDPMVSNSITNRALRATVHDAFAKRGYVDVEWMPDFVVAVYASAKETLDLAQWQFGYSYWPRWWLSGTPTSATVYNEGTVIVDVIDPETLDLLWRGSATARLGDDPADNTKALQKVAAAIIEKFPRAKTGPLVAGR